MEALRFNISNLFLAAESYILTGNFEFPEGPIKLSTHGNRSMSEECGSGKEGTPV